MRTLSELSRRTGCSNCCGSCAELANEILSEAHGARSLNLPLIAIAA